MKSVFLLDTNTFSYIAKGSSATARVEFRKVSQDRNSVVCISCITLAEIHYGIAKHGLSGARLSAIEGLLANLEVLPWGEGEAAAYGRMRVRLESKGITVAAMDMLIAAQAIAAEATLVSHDGIFQRIDGLDARVDWATDVAPRRK